MAHCVGQSMSAVGSNAAARQLRFLGVAPSHPDVGFLGKADLHCLAPTYNALGSGAFDCKNEAADAKVYRLVVLARSSAFSRSSDLILSCKG
jgi:hypothetical protein